jgi:hypothetical protein
MYKFRVLCLLLAIALFAATGFPAALTDSLKAGKADLKSASVLTFGPEGILFVGDSVGATLYAMDTGDRTPSPTAQVSVKGINEKIAAMLGTMPDQIAINDLAVNPISKKMYLAVSRGKGANAMPVIVRVDAKGKIETLPLDNVKHSKIALVDPPESKEGAFHPLLVTGGNPRLDAFSDLAFVDGKVLVAGLSNEEFASTLRAVPFPFAQDAKGTGIEIWHGSHGRFETEAPIHTFVPYKIKGETNILASYTCTPLVKIPVAELKPGAKVKGTTIAELGSGNRPLDMIAYTKGGHNYFLMSNTNRGMMKISADNLENYKPITTPSDIAGVPYEIVKTLQDVSPYPAVASQGVEQLDKVDVTTAAILWRTSTGSRDLQTIALP